jgi:hypothetical protein
MKTYHCDHCQSLLFFESIQCVKCAHQLAYVPPLARIASLEPVAAGLYRIATKKDTGERYKLCANYTNEHVCNWALPQEDANTLCLSCRLTQVIPDLTVAGNREVWAKLELAKRRMLYTLLALKCPVQSKTEDPNQGLAYSFLASVPGQPRVLTGHDNGLITVNIAEADDSTREKERNRLHEPYRTLLGHFRHEIGHYYWQRLVDNSPRLDAFRALFGDERADYAASLQKHYDAGPQPGWEQQFISHYAASHPWEDWAESWAHYMHMVDMLETAADNGLKLEPERADEPTLKAAKALKSGAFDDLIRNWFPLTYVLNNLNRSMGLPDGYPFVLSNAVIEKLRFIHETVH